VTRAFPRGFDNGDNDGVFVLWHPLRHRLARKGDGNSSRDSGGRCRTAGYVPHGAPGYVPSHVFANDGTILGFR